MFYTLKEVIKLMNTHTKMFNESVCRYALVLVLLAGLVAPSLAFAQSGGGQGGGQPRTVQGTMNGVVNSVNRTANNFFNRPVSTTINVVTGTITTVVGGAYDFVRNTYVDIRNIVTGQPSRINPVNTSVSDPKKGGGTQPTTQPNSGGKPKGAIGGTTIGGSGSKPTGSKGSVGNPLSGGESSGGRSKDDPIRTSSPGTSGVGENNPADDKAKDN